MTCVYTREGRRCGRPATTVCALCGQPACFEHGAPPIHFGPMRPLPEAAR